jgi:ribonuclease-3
VSSRPPQPHSKLAAAIGYEFASEDILVRALTHASFDAQRDGELPTNYERLEFLGDRVLGLVIAHVLYERFPESEEGGLATRYNALVRKETCARVAEEIELGRYLRLSSGEVSAGGRRKMAILGNACEALIAAVYLDGGFDAARTFIERYWLALLDDVREPPKDAKTALQEWAQGRGLAAPSYRVVDRTGPDHAPRFTMAVTIADMSDALGEGSSKRAAQQDAAERFLAREGIGES